MQRIALILACVGPALASIEPLLHSYGFPELPYPHLAFCLPAVVFGVRDAFKVRGYARSAPMLACVCVAAASLLWVEDTERGRGMVIVATILTGVAVSVTIVRQRAQRLGAQAFVLGSLANLVLVFINTVDSDGRLGQLIIEEYSYASNPNAFGGQMAAAAILTVAFFVVDRDKPGYGPLGIFDNYTFSCFLAVIFYVATLMSASRGALACLALVTPILLFAGRTTTNRLSVMVAALLVVLCLISAGVDLFDPVLERFSDGENVATLGDRLPIWSAATEAIADSPWRGFGVGGVERTLAVYFPYQEGVKLGDDGVRRKASHNSYVEWLVAVGAAGVIPAVWLLVRVLRDAIFFDRWQGTVHRRALVAFVCLLSISTIVFRLPYSIPIVAIALASLNPPGVLRQKAGQVTQQRAMSHASPSPRRLPMRRRSFQPKLGVET